MKGTRAQNTKQSKQGITHLPKPDIRDNLDSREGEEQRIKGDDISHNRKQTKEKHLKKRGETK